MADKRISDPSIPDASVAALNDIFLMVDVDDPTDHSTGTDNRITRENWNYNSAGPAYGASTGQIADGDTLQQCLAKIKNSYRTNTQLDATYEQLTNKGASNGYAPLDANAKVPDAQISQTSVQQHVIGSELVAPTEATAILKLKMHATQSVDPFSVVTDGDVEVFTITADGNVGIGNSIVSTSGGNVTIDPDGSGQIHLKTGTGAGVLVESTIAGTPANYIQFKDTGGNTAYFGMSSGSTDDFTIRNEVSSALLQLSANGGNIKLTTSGNLEFDGNAIVTSHNSKDFGTASSAFRDGYFGRKIAVGGSALATATIYGHDAADETLVAAAHASATSSQRVLGIRDASAAFILSTYESGDMSLGADFTPASNSIMTREKDFLLDYTSASTRRHFGLRRDNSAVFFLGVANINDDLISGSSIGDVALRAVNADILFSADNGSTDHLRINSDDSIALNGSILTLNAGRNESVKTVNAATYDLLETDYILDVTYTSTGAVTSLTLPTAQTVRGRVIVIKDAGLNSSVNNITIDTEGSQLIEGSSTYVINIDGAAIRLYCNGTNWYII